MRLRMFASQQLAALFVVGLAFGSTAARADEDVYRPRHRPHYRHVQHHTYHHRIAPRVVEQPVVEQPVTYVSNCGGCGVRYVAPQPVYVPPPVQYVPSCGCNHLAAVEPIVQQPYYGGSFYGAGYYGGGYRFGWGHGARRYAGFHRYHAW